MALGYTKTVYQNGVAPALSATNLNKNETALQAVSDWADGLLASTGVPNAAKAVKALGADLAALLTAAGYSLAPATGTDNLDNIADGTTYKRILAAIATALNAGNAPSLLFKTTLSTQDWDTLASGEYSINGGIPSAHGPKGAVETYGRAFSCVDGGYYKFQLYFDYSAAYPKYRVCEGSTWSSWCTIWTSSNDGNGGQPPSAKSNKTSNATIGWFDVVDCASGASVTLPAGGTFEWFVTTYGATYNSAKSGESAGGAMTGTASANLTMYYKRKTA